MRPTFNVTEFQDVVNIQMNDSMRMLITNFIDEVDNDDGLEIELKAFRNALLDPQGDNRRTSNRERFNKNSKQVKYQRRQSDDCNEQIPPADYQDRRGQ